jgi:glucose-6-phosphate isomerase
MQSVVQAGVSADAITLDKVSPQNIGALIIYYELLTSLVGAMLNVNTYDQPGVELGKVILYKNLDK